MFDPHAQMPTTTRPLPDHTYKVIAFVLVFLGMCFALGLLLYLILPRPSHAASILTASVYCFDLVPLRSSSRWTRRHDDVLRAEYFPGLDPTMLIEPLREAGKPLWGPNATKAIVNRLSHLGLRNRRNPS